MIEENKKLKVALELNTPVQTNSLGSEGKSVLRRPIPAYTQFLREQYQIMKDHNVMDGKDELGVGEGVFHGVLEGDRTALEGAVSRRKEAVLGIRVCFGLSVESFSAGNGLLFGGEERTRDSKHSPLLLRCFVALLYLQKVVLFELAYAQMWEYGHLRYQSHGGGLFSSFSITPVAVDEG